MTLVENLQRKNLGPIEEALAFKEVLDRTGWTHEELAKKLGKSRPYVSKRLMLLDLDEKMATAVHRGLIPMSVALELKRIDHEVTRDIYLESAIKYGSNVETVHYWVENYLREKKAREAAGEVEYRAEVTPPPREITQQCYICEQMVPVSRIMGVALCVDCAHGILEVIAGEKRKARMAQASN